MIHAPPNDDTAVWIPNVVHGQSSTCMCQQQPATQYQSPPSTVVEEVLVRMVLVPVGGESTEGDVGETVESREFGVR